MSSREQYAPGTASGAEIRKDGAQGTLVLVRELSHPPEKVWKALTDPEHLREWAPFDSDRNLDGWQRLHAEYAKLLGILPPDGAARQRT